MPGANKALFGAASAGSGSLSHATVHILFMRANFLSLSSLKELFGVGGAFF
jgi:hypothetical protein